MSLPLSAIPIPVASYETTLAADLTAAATSLTVVDATDDAGNAITGVVGLTVDGEFLVGSKSGATVSSLLRGVDPQDGVTERTSLKAAHVRGTPVVITDAPFLAVAYRLMNGTEGFPNRIKMAADADTAVAEAFVTFGQLSRQAIAGAANASETVAGLTQEGTAAQHASGAAAGSVARLFATPAKTAATVQSGSWLYAASTTGSDTYAAAFTPTLTAYTTGMSFLIKFTTANTAAATLNIDSLGAKDIKKYVAGAIAALETGDIVAAQICQFAYDGTQFILLNPGATTMTTALATEASTFFSNTDITGAEAETLTAGNAIATLHFHKKTFGSVQPTAGNYAHGLGVLPKRIRITLISAIANHSATSLMESDGSTHAFTYATTVSGTVQVGTTATIAALAAGGTLRTATVSFDATNITVSAWSAETPNGYMLWEAEV